MFDVERDQYAESHRVGPGWRLWCVWVLATVIGGVLGRTLGLTIESPLPDEGPFYIGGLVFSGAASGVVIGFAQGLVLLPYLKARGAQEWFVATIIGRAGRWVLTSTIGAAAISSLNNWHPYNSAAALVVWLLTLALVWSVAGGMVGLAQWFVLRRQAYHAEWWILANAGGSALAIVLSATNFINDPSNDTSIFTVLSQAVYGAATGIALIDLLRHPRPEATWRLATKPEPMIEPSTDTVLGSDFYGTEEYNEAAQEAGNLQRGDTQ